MDTRYIVSNMTGQAFASAVTRYQPLSGTLFGSGGSGTEANAQIRIKDSYTAKNLFCYVSANTITATSNVSLKINGGAASANVTIPIAADTTGLFEDITGSDALVDTDLIVYVLVVGTDAASTITFTQMGCVLTHAGTTSMLISSAAGSGLATDLGDSLLGGVLNLSATEAQRQFKVRRPTQITNLRTYIPNNTRDGDSTWTSQINGGAGNLVVTVGAGLTGEFTEAVPATDTLVFGDLYSVQWDLGGTTGTYGGNILQVESTRDHPYCSVAAQATSTAVYWAFHGFNVAGSATEAPAQTTARLGRSYLQYLRTVISANSRDADATFALRRNGANAIVLTVPTTLTGAFEEVGTRIGLADDDEVNYLFDASAGTTGTVTPTVIEIHQVSGSQPLADSWMNQKAWSGGMN